MEFNKFLEISKYIKLGLNSDNAVQKKEMKYEQTGKLMEL